VCHQDPVPSKLTLCDSMVSSQRANARGVDPEQTPGRPTRKQQQSRSSPMLRHLATISMSTQKRSDPRRRLEPTSTYMRPCSHRAICKANLLPQSNYQEGGITSPMTRMSRQRVRDFVATLVIRPRPKAQGERAGSRLGWVPNRVALPLFRDE
jgi:hypothetical protein